MVYLRNLFFCLWLCSCVIVLIILRSGPGHGENTSFVTNQQANEIPTEDSSAKPILAVDSTERRRKRFPDAIIIGGRKCGTSVLERILNYHPYIKTAGDGNHEPRYFCLNHTRGTHNRGIKWYINQMPLTTGKQQTIEKSACYFHEKQAPRVVREVSRDVKLLLILRNPLIRSVSDYYFELRRYAKANVSFKVTLSEIFDFGGPKYDANNRAITVSLYDVHYNWREWFPREQILIVDGDNLKVHPVQELSKIENFLNISHEFKNQYTKIPKEIIVENTHTSSKYLEQFSRDTLKKLATFLQPHAQEFCEVALVNYTWCTDMYHDAHLLGYL